MGNRQSKRYLRFLEPGRNAGANSKDAGRNIGIALGIFSLLFVYIWLYMQSVKMNYQVNELTKQRDSLKAENRILEFNLQSMVSSRSIEAVARERYGFKTPAPGAVVVIKQEKNIFARIIGKLGIANF